MAANATATLTVRLKDQVSAPARGIRSVIKGVSQSFSKLKGGFDLAGHVSLAANAVNQLGQQSRAVLTSILQPSLRFEETITRVGALTTGVTAKQFKELEATAREMGRTTRFTAQEAAEGLSQLAVAGFNAEQQMAALPSVLKLTQTSGMEMGRVADIASDLMGGFGKEAKDMAEISGVLTATFSNSTTTLETLFETLKFGAPIAKAAGISMQETAVLTGLLGNAGIKGSMAGTGLRTMIRSLTGPSKAAQKELRKLGITSSVMADNLDKPATLLKKISDAFKDKNYGRADRLRVLNRVFGRASTAMEVLLSNANKVGKDGVTSFDKLLGAVNDGENALDKMAKTMDSTRLASVRKLESAIESLKLDLAQELAPTLSVLVKDLIGMVGQFAAWAKQHPDLTRKLGKTLIAVTAFATVLGPILITLASLVSAFTLLKGAVIAVTAPFRIFGVANTALAAKMRGTTGATRGLTASMRSLNAVVGLVGAAWAGWEVGQMLDSLLGKVLALRGGLLSTEMALSAGESPVVNRAVRMIGETTGIQSITDIAEGNIRRNEEEQKASLRAQEAELADLKRELAATEKAVAVGGKIEIEVSDDRTRVRRVQKAPQGPDLEVGTSAVTP
jgi:TP901 family phage tail tape measure protein